jgi:DNA-binding NtrC family response regulator
MSRRAKEPFIAINCGAISPSLIESELFGHEKGAFTGANKQHRGVFERANGGTLLLDEIGDMPLELQVKLLRVLETGGVQRIGGSETAEIDVRVISATNQNPEEAVRAGRLRQDLMHRLLVFPIEVPSLRERTEDIEFLAHHFLDQINAQDGAEHKKVWSAAALEKLIGHSWPGNVRELRNVVERASIMADLEILDEHIWITREGRSRSAATGPAGPAGPAGRAGPAGPAGPSGPGGEPPSAGAGEESDTVLVEVGMSVAEAEKELIIRTLQSCEGNKTKAAQVLGVSLKTLYNRLNEYASEA